MQLDGGPANQRGIGTKVKLFCKGQQFYQEQSPVRGFQSSSDPVLNFGVGKNALIDSILVIWPNDKYQKLISVKPNQSLVIKMADAGGRWNYDTVADKNKSLLTQTILPGVHHKENSFSDFAVQILLLNYLSRQGPCIEVADVNKDGLEDFLLAALRAEWLNFLCKIKTILFHQSPHLHL